MKTIKMLAMAAIVCAAVACNSTKPAAEGEEAADITNPSALLPSKAVNDSVSYLMGINFGSFIKGYGFGKKLNYAEIKKGMDDFINAQGNQADTNFVKQFKINPEEMNRMFGEYLQKMTQYTLAVNKDKEAKFLAANAKKPGVQTTESGLQYIISEPGNDVKPTAMDTVFVHYVGKLTDGTIFDQTTEAAPSAMLMMNRVIAGWTEGLGLIGEGGKATLFVPAELGYGERGQQAIEPNSTLIFDVTLDSVRRYVAPAPEAE
ncbi:MAG: FKBP-type peptidyl-prolyl cis-trans isomerase [Bacteroidales bacterium]|nr:FKBP-type peptidyl-prolyl cis-trans isomerase [Candidatus Cryptobacteroides faecihippi]